jgi:hypothetical protein
MIEAVKVVASVREPAMLEPIPTVVTLNESITITMLETATLAAFCEPRSTSPGPSKAAAVMPRHCAVMPMAAAVAPRHCAGMATMAVMAPTAATIELNGMGGVPGICRGLGSIASPQCLRGPLLGSSDVERRVEVCPSGHSLDSSTRRSP